MKLRSVQIKNFKSIADSDVVELGSINVLIGPNNSGKSALMQALYSLQEGSSFLTKECIRIGSDHFEVIAHCDGWSDNPWGYSHPTTPPESMTLSYKQGDPPGVLLQPTGIRLGAIPAAEPQAFIYPILAKRKVLQLTRQTNRQLGSVVQPSFQNIATKVQRASNTGYPGSALYRDACTEILGFIPTVYDDDEGPRVGVWVNENEAIPIEQMGEGVLSIVGVLANLAYAKNKLFLIEELENDLHPKALNALLDLVTESAKSNQFIISTHSNLVVRFLGSNSDTKLFRVARDPREEPLSPSQFSKIGTTTEERREVLAELGYSSQDYLGEAWLIFEEASAEFIVRKYFLKWYAPKLVGGLITVASDGTSDVAPRFSDYRRLFTFLHLNDPSRKRAWVCCDGDDAGKEAISKLQTTFSDWPSDHFVSFNETSFEKYYPPNFTAKANTILQMAHGMEKQSEKAKLLKEVAEWIDENEVEAKRHFKSAAREIVDLLTKIEGDLQA